MWIFRPDIQFWCLKTIQIIAHLSGEKIQVGALNLSVGWFPSISVCILSRKGADAILSTPAPPPYRRLGSLTVGRPSSISPASLRVCRRLSVLSASSSLFWCVLRKRRKRTHILKNNSCLCGVLRACLYVRVGSELFCCRSSSVESLRITSVSPVVAIDRQLFWITCAADSTRASPLEP